MKPSQDKSISTSLIKGLDLLSLLAQRGREASIQELSRELGQPRTTVLRFLQTLIEYGLAEREEGRYRIASGFHEWTQKDQFHGIKQLGRSLLERVARETGELTMLGIQEGRGTIHLDRILSDYPIAVAPMEERFELEKTAMGKLVLSRRPDLIRKIKSVSLKREINLARIEGVAWNREETHQGVITMACWVHREGAVRPMIGVAWPVFRFTEKKAKRVVDLILSSEKNILKR